MAEQEISNFTKKLLDEIVFHNNYPILKYKAIEHEKKQIVIHHTVSGNGVEGDIQWWIQSLFRIGTSFIIDRNGVIHQLFNSKYYANHLGVKNSFLLKNGITDIDGEQLEQNSIGIELDSWGGIMKSNGLYYPTIYDKQRNLYVPNNKCKPLMPEMVQHYPQAYRGFNYFEKYTEAQIDSLYNLLRYLTTKFSIPRTYSSDMWDVSKNALSGKKGIWTHVSYREFQDKSDCHPQPELIAMLKNLQKSYIKTWKVGQKI